MVKRCGIVAKEENEDTLSLALRIYEFLTSKGIEVLPEQHIAKIKHLKQGRELKSMHVDFIVTIGGDGTVLRTCMHAPDPETPILAVNMGRLGYLTEVEPDQVFQSLKDYLAGNYRLDLHSKLTISSGGKHLADSLNEVLVTTSSPSKMIHLNLTLDGEESTQFSADGVIVSTPTGSTAHAFSAGGSILHPSLDAFNLVLICPLEPIRSIIIPGSKKISLRLGKNTSTLVTIDGTFEQKLPSGSEIIIEKAKNKAVFVRFGVRLFSKSIDQLFSRGVKI